MIRSIPWLLVGFRVVAGPLILALAFAGQGVACALLLSAGVLSDIFDGIVARRIGVSTPRLRTWDSRADVMFWLFSLFGLILLRPSLAADLGLAALLIGALEVGNHLFSYLKFRREASPHHYLSKAFGLGLWLLFGLGFAVGEVGVVLFAVLALGVVSQIEAFAITWRLKAWRCDVPSVFGLR